MAILFRFFAFKDVLKYLFLIVFFEHQPKIAKKMAQKKR